ncbi:Uncharacterised protein [Mycobacteroides abscessus subsp. abscessus]|nr:Uncharacterised protein [Mycobacteroides abscessus subsp. abscessus]
MFSTVPARPDSTVRNLPAHRLRARTASAGICAVAEKESFARRTLFKGGAA